MGKLIVELSEELHKELKKAAAMNHRTIKDVVTHLVEDYLSRGEENQDLEETGLCGKWEDTRTPDEIIADIKAYRHWLRKGRQRVA